ncbi:hypothetical protein [Haloparvum sp. PAK95]|uniref:hypothetical protein n=1 Tax=Haloparvum sp. PAK95 TaxID=3418962 RepID=UPI003D2F0DEB
MSDSSQSLIATLYAIDVDSEVVVETESGDRITGKPSRIERDEAGVRVELCPYDGNAPQYRVRADRTPLGWRAITVERRPLHGDWSECGRLADLVV